MLLFRSNLTKTTAYYEITSLTAVAATGNSLCTTHAQIGAYSFAASQGTFTYVSFANSIYSIRDDAAISEPIPIGFEFIFNGVPYTKVYAASDGYLSFNASAASTPVNNLAASVATNLPLLAPLWDDLSGIVYNSSYYPNFSYATSGVTGGRVFTAEWKNWVWNRPAQGLIISFQVKLYEGSNKIVFVYKPESGSVISGSASIGIAGSGMGPGNFLSLSNGSTSPTVSASTETTTIAGSPVAGQTYTFTPSPPPATDLSIISINTAASDCNISATPVSATIRNAGAGSIDFSGSNASIAVNVIGPAPQTLSATISNGTLALGASRAVTLSPVANLSAGGTYSFQSLVWCREMVIPVMIPLSHL